MMTLYFWYVGVTVAVSPFLFKYVFEQKWSLDCFIGWPIGAFWLLFFPYRMMETHHGPGDFQSWLIMIGLFLSAVTVLLPLVLALVMLYLPIHAAGCFLLGQFLKWRESNERFL